MRTILGTLTLTLIFGSVAAMAQEPGGPEVPKPPELKRGFIDGQFVDDFFGLSYEAEGLERGFSMGGPNVLFSGRLPGGVEVEISILEGPEIWDGQHWREEMKKAWAQDGEERKEMAEGDDPVPYAMFVQESLAGFERHHGYAFYTRGHQLVNVHVTVREKSETSETDIKTAFAGLKMDPDNQAWLMAHLIAKQAGTDPRDPRLLPDIAMNYMRGPVAIPEYALKALEPINLDHEAFTPDQRWNLYQTKGLALLTLRRLEEAVPVWEKIVDLAKATTDAANYGSNSNYNLACAYSLAGDLDKAFAALKASFSMGDPEQISGLRAHSQEDGDLEPMRADPRWKEMFGAEGE